MLSIVMFLSICFILSEKAFAGTAVPGVASSGCNSVKSSQQERTVTVSGEAETARGTHNADDSYEWLINEDTDEVIAEGQKLAAEDVLHEHGI